MAAGSEHHDIGVTVVLFDVHAARPDEIHAIGRLTLPAHVLSGVEHDPGGGLGDQSQRIGVEVLEEVDLLQRLGLRRHRRAPWVSWCSRRLDRGTGRQYMQAVTPLHLSES